MGVYEGRGQLAKAMKELLARWAETREDWDDSVSKAFEKRVLLALEMDMRQATSGMDAMAQLLAACKRDCGEG